MRVSTVTVPLASSLLAAPRLLAGGEEPQRHEVLARALLELVLRKKAQVHPPSSPALRRREQLGPIFPLVREDRDSTVSFQPDAVDPVLGHDLHRAFWFTRSWARRSRSFRNSKRDGSIGADVSGR